MHIEEEKKCRRRKFDFLLLMVIAVLLVGGALAESQLHNAAAINSACEWAAAICGFYLWFRVLGLIE
jgi:hypothetical protein